MGLYETYNNSFYNPNDDIPKPGYNQDWEAVQRGFYRVAASQETQDNTIAANTAAINELQEDVDSLESGATFLRLSGLTGMTSSVSVGDTMTMFFTAPANTYDFSKFTAGTIYEILPEIEITGSANTWFNIIDLKYTFYGSDSAQNAHGNAVKLEDDVDHMTLYLGVINRGTAAGTATVNVTLNFRAMAVEEMHV